VKDDKFQSLADTASGALPINKAMVGCCSGVIFFTVSMTFSAVCF
jgi:hypothetical protein